MSSTKGHLPNSTAAPHFSNTKVIVVGIGLAGLTAAFECYRKGHSVILLERYPEVPTSTNIPATILTRDVLINSCSRPP